MMISSEETKKKKNDGGSVSEAQPVVAIPQVS